MAEQMKKRGRKNKYATAAQEIPVATPPIASANPAVVTPPTAPAQTELAAQAPTTAGTDPKAP